MAHRIEEAKSGRASCRTCRQAIAKGELRFGEEAPGQFGGGGEPSVRWHHLACAARAVPDALQSTLEIFDGEIPDRAALDALIVEGRKQTKPGTFPYVERAPSGRAHCIVCEATIEKTALRVAVERDLEVGAMVTKGAAYLHPGCIAGYLDKQAVERDLFVEGLRTNSRVSSDEVDEVLSDQPMTDPS